MPLPVIQPGRWVELAGTSFGSVANGLGIPTALLHGGENRGAIFTAWNSATYDAVRQLFISLRSGGHGDWGGNQVLAFSLQTLAWSVLYPLDSLAASFGSTGYAALLDGNTPKQILADTKLFCTSSGVDNRTITANGFDDTNTAIEEVIQLVDTNVVQSVNTFRWLNSLTLSAPGSGQTVTVKDSVGTWTLWNAVGSDVHRTTFSGPYPPGTGAFKGVGTPFARSAYWDSINQQDSTTKPSSVHTYDTQAHMIGAGIDQYYSGGGIFYGAGGESVPQTAWWFDPVAHTWIRKATRHGGVGCCTAWDSFNGLLWLKYNGGFSSYAPLTDTSTLRKSTSLGDTLMGVNTIDDTTHTLYHVYANNASATSLGVIAYNVTNPASITETTLTSTGTVNVQKPGSTTQEYEGIAAFYAAGRLAAYGWNAGKTRGAIYSRDPSTGAWSRHDPDDGVEPPGVGNTGIWKRFFSPDGVHAMIYLTETDNWWVYRMPWASPTPGVPTAVSVSVA